MSRFLKAIQSVGEAFRVSDPSEQNWIHSTVTASDATSVRWATPKAAEYVAKLRQWPMILADKNAAMMAATPMRLYRMSGGKASKATLRHLRKARGKNYTGSESEITSGAALDILNTPNAYESGQTFSYLKHFCKQAAGNYYRMWDNDSFYSMRPQFVRPVIDRIDPMIRGFIYSRERSNDLMFSFEDIDHMFHRPSIDNPYIGVAPMQACIEYQNLMLNATLAEGKRWENGGRPPYAIKLPDTLTPIAVQQAKETVKRDITGVFNSGKPLVAQLAEIVNFGFPPNEMEYLEGQQTSLLVICNAYGVPISLVDHNAAKDSVSNQAMRTWVDGTIWPLLCNDAADETRAFRRQGLIGENDFFAYDAPTDEDRGDLVAVLQKECDSGFTTYDEAREELGRDPIPNGLGKLHRYKGVVISDKPTQPVKVDPNNDSEQPKEDSKASKSLDSMSGNDGDASRVKAIATLDERDAADLERQKKVEERTRDLLALWFLSLLDTLNETATVTTTPGVVAAPLGFAPATSISVPVGGIVTPPAMTVDVNWTIPPAKVQELDKIIQSGQHEAIRANIADDAAQTGLKPISQLKPIQIADQRRVTMIEKITNTTQNDIRSAISEGIKEGKTVQEVAEDLKAAGYSKERAELIASNEIAYASEVAAEEFAKERGLAFKTLYLGPVPCKLCIADKVDENSRGGSTPIAQPYLNGNVHPPFHVNCYCTVVYHNRRPSGGV